MYLQTSPGKGGAYLYDIHFWLGKDTSQVQHALYQFMMFFFFLCLVYVIVAQMDLLHDLKIKIRMKLERQQ